MSVINRKNVLPIKTNASITSECWTYYKLAIIETSQSYIPWLASHISIFYDNKFNLFFGKYDDQFHLDYFNEILHYEEIPIEQIDHKEIVNIIISEIDAGRYIITYLPHSRTMVHETVFYGYDMNEKLLFYIDLIDGKFRETSISYNDFIEEFEKVYDYFRRHTFSRFIISWYFFPITRLIAREYTDDFCLQKAINNLLKECNGKRIEFINIDDNKCFEEKEVHYSGLGCYIGVENRLNEYIRDQRFIVGDVFKDLSVQLVNCLYKLYEYQQILLISTKWIRDKLEDEEKLNKYVAVLEEYLSNMNRIVLLSIKFREKGNWSDFYKLQKEFVSLYPSIKIVLNSFCDEANELLMEKISISG